MKNALALNFLAALLVVLGIVSQSQADNLLELVKEIIGDSSSSSTKSVTTHQTYLVEKVVDGDTIKVRMNGSLETVRLVGINTPESVDPRKEVECFGVQASDVLEEILLNQSVTLQSDDTQADRDRYGRLLRFVFLDGQDVGLWLLQEGYARESLYSDTPHVYRDAYLAAEQAAQEAGRGLWAEGVCEK